MCNESKNKEKQPSLRCFSTGIGSLDDLFLSPKSGEPGGVNNGIVYHAKSGLWGVISGSAGSGKSILSLQLAYTYASTAGTDGKPRQALLVTTEPLGAIEEKILRQFGRFGFCEAQGAKIQQLASRGIPPSDETQRSCLFLSRLPLDPVMQKSRLEHLFSSVADADRRRKTLVCLDNAESVARGALPFEQTPPTLGLGLTHSERDLFFKRLRNVCAQYEMSIWLAFEEQHHADDSGDFWISTTDEAYAADVVIRLGTRICATGFRERTLEIVKAKHQAYRRGRHHFSIRSLSLPESAMHRECGAIKEPLGVVIYPSLATQLYLLGGRDHPCTPRAEASGTNRPSERKSFPIGLLEVDKEVARRNPRKVGADDHCYLAEGTVSVLVSDLDSTASEIALQFARAKPELPTLYICLGCDPISLGFEPGAESNPAIVRLLPEHISESKLLQDIDNWTLGNKLPNFSAKSHKGKPGEGGRVILDSLYGFGRKFPLIRDERHFFAALFDLFRKRGVAALVIDTVEVGEGRNPISESFAAGLADHVFALRHVELGSRVCRVFSVLKLTGLREPSIIWELERTADREIRARDRLKFFKGLLAGRPEPVDVTMSLFADAPGCPLDKFLDTQEQILTRTFGQRVKIHRCYADGYGALQQGIGSNIVTVGDCHVISVDEIWLSDLLKKESRKLEFIPWHLLRDEPDETDHWQGEEYVTTAHDFAVLTASEEMPTKQGTYAVPVRHNVGILVYDPGVAAMAKEGKKGKKGKKGEASKIDTAWLWDWVGKQIPKGTDSPDDFPYRLRQVLVEQAEKRSGKKDTEQALCWSQLVELQTAYVGCLRKILCKDGLTPLHDQICRDWEPDPKEKKKRKPRKRAKSLPRWGVFTFSMDQRESCVSFLLELLLSCIGKEEGIGKLLLVEDGFKGENVYPFNWETKVSCSQLKEIGITSDKDVTLWCGGLSLLLHLLSPIDILRLSQGWLRPMANERPCLFSRQWWSGWGMMGLKSAGAEVVELPVGLSGRPTPVSGAWYLGILRDSAAVGAGARLIRHFTSKQMEVHKANRAIGMPVRTRLYEDHVAEIRNPIPYRTLLKEVGADLKMWWDECSKQQEELEAEAKGLKERLTRRASLAVDAFESREIEKAMHEAELVRTAKMEGAKVGAGAFKSTLSASAIVNRAKAEAKEIEVEIVNLARDKAQKLRKEKIGMAEMTAKKIVEKRLQAARKLVAGSYRKLLKETMTPFSRCLILKYNLVSPLLFSLMVRVAGLALDERFRHWLWYRDPKGKGYPENVEKEIAKEWSALREEIEKEISKVETRYKAIVNGN